MCMFSLHVFLRILTFISIFQLHYCNNFDVIFAQSNDYYCYNSCRREWTSIGLPSVVFLPYTLLVYITHPVPIHSHPFQSPIARSLCYIV